MDFFTIVVIVFIAFCVFVWFKSKHYQWVDWGNGGLNFIDGLNRWFGMAYHRLHVDNIPLLHDKKAMLKADGTPQGFVLICNHISGLDPFLMIAGSKRPLRFLIAREQYERKELHWLLKRIKYIPVDRMGIDPKCNSKSVFSAASKALADGDVVCIYPQAGIVGGNGNGRVDKLKMGAFKIAKDYKVPLVITTISGIAGHGEEAGALIKRSHARIHYHKTVHINEDYPMDKCVEETKALFLAANNPLREVIESKI